MSLNPAAHGWIGRASELYATLAAFHCDTTADGKYKVRGEISSFMGAGDEFVVHPDAVFFVNGLEHNLCSALGVTSYGQGVTVI